MRLLFCFLLASSTLAGELTDKAIAQIKEAAKADADGLRAKWNFFDDAELRANVLIKLRKETDRTAAALKFLEERVKPAIPEEDWLALKDRVERAAKAAGRGDPPPQGDTHGRAFRYGTDAQLLMESIWISFKNPRAN